MFQVTKNGKTSPPSAAMVILQETLVRKIKEELDADITVGELFETVEYDYPTFHLTMHCFFYSRITQRFRGSRCFYRNLYFLFDMNIV